MTDEKNPREWWISNAGVGYNISGQYKVYTAVDVKPQNPPWTHVIEKSAFDDLERQLAEAKAEILRSRELGEKMGGYYEAMLEERDQLHTEVERLKKVAGETDLIMMTHEQYQSRENIIDRLDEFIQKVYDDPSVIKASEFRTILTEITKFKEEK